MSSHVRPLSHRGDSKTLIFSGVPLGSQSIDQVSRAWFPCCCVLYALLFSLKAFWPVRIRTYLRISKMCNRVPGSYSNWLRPLRSIRIRLCRRSWPRPLIPNKSSKPTDGCTRILICKAKPWDKLSTGNLGVRASRPSLHFHRSLEAWIRTSPGPRL